MKNFLLTCAILVPLFLWSKAPEQSFYIGEMKCQYLHESHLEHFGIFFMKRSFSPETNMLTDFCLLISPTEGSFSFVHVSLLEDNSSEFYASNPDSEFIGEGRLFGCPYYWTESHEHIELDNEGVVQVDIENMKLKEGTILSKAKVFLNEGDVDQDAPCFATFSAYLYPVDPQKLEFFLQGWLEEGILDKGLLSLQQDFSSNILFGSKKGYDSLDIFLGVE